MREVEEVLSLKDLVREFEKKKPYLFWDIKDPLNLSEDAPVEIILNRGDFDDFLRLINIMGIARIAEIFNRQVSGPRKNYSKKIENFFREFFKRNLNA